MSAQSLKVLIVAGGLTHERDVSVRSGRRVANSLVNQGFAAKVFDLIKPSLGNFGFSARCYLAACAWLHR